VALKLFSCKGNKTRELNLR